MKFQNRGFKTGSFAVTHGRTLTINVLQKLERVVVDVAHKNCILQKLLIESLELFA
jgi:hypothetical protein